MHCKPCTSNQGLGIAQAGNRASQLVLTRSLLVSFLPSMQAAQAFAHDLDLDLELQQATSAVRGLTTKVMGDPILHLMMTAPKIFAIHTAY